MSTKDKIIKFLKKNNKASVETLRKEFSISRQIVHRHLKEFIEDGLVSKVGTPPTVFYILAQKEKLPKFDLPKDKMHFLEKNYLWISPGGEMFFGVEGLVRWAKSVGQENQLDLLVNEFIKIREEVNEQIQEDDLIGATFKLNSTFDSVNLQKLYYLDFYALPKFGKTPTGQLVLYSKQAQQEQLIKELVIRAKNPINSLIKKHSIDAVAFIPPTIKRQVQFLKVLEDRLSLNLPKIELVKAYKGQIPIAQKTLSKLGQRIKNARESIYIKNDRVGYRNVLLIDDAVGSGASMNEVAKKLVEQDVAERVYGFALVGSYKGFDVISEI